MTTVMMTSTRQQQRQQQHRRCIQLYHGSRRLVTALFFIVVVAIIAILSANNNADYHVHVVHGWTTTTTMPSSTTRFNNNNFIRQQQQRTLATTFITTSSSTTSSTPSTSSSSTSLHVVGRIRDSILSRPRTDKDLKIGIAGFYDRSSRLWEDVWGEHMHHGYYIPPDRTDHIQAQIDLIDEVLQWANVTATAPATAAAINTAAAPFKVVDVGCGIGGSSRHIARKFAGGGAVATTQGCTTEGVTLSPYQAQRATELAQEQGLEDKCRFQVADALDMPFQDNEFDLVWSLESGEHMPNKTKFVDELFRVAKPGTGKILIVTWCHRDLEDGETRYVHVRVHSYNITLR
jgi:ubiquinone/menaquinone biosynthesis C-methylase UbiE